MCEPRCFKCDEKLKSSMTDESPWNMASGAVIMSGGGSFGSSLYDSMVDGVSIKILVCDKCLRENKYKVKEIENGRTW